MYEFHSSTEASYLHSDEQHEWQQVFTEHLLWPPAWTFPALGQDLPTGQRTGSRKAAGSFHMFLWGFCFHLGVLEDLEIQFQHHNKAVPWSADPEEAGETPGPPHALWTTSLGQNKISHQASEKMKDLDWETKAPF